MCSVLIFSRPRSEGWPHHGRTFSIYLCPLSFWLTLPRGILFTSWCCPSGPCVVFFVCEHLALFLASSLTPGNFLVSSWCDHSMLVSLLWQWTDSWIMLYRDLFVNERSADGQRQGRDLLQPVLVVSSTLQRCAASLPSDETHYGRHRRGEDEQARPGPRRQLGRGGTCRPWTWWRGCQTNLDHTYFTIVVSYIRPTSVQRQSTNKLKHI